MRGAVTNMIVTIILLSSVCGFVQSSGGEEFVSHTGPAPVVTSASSQYFERTFNRLVAVPPPPQPVFPVASPPQPVFPVASPPQPVFPVASPPQPVFPVASPQQPVFNLAPPPPVVPVVRSPSFVPIPAPPPVLTIPSVPNVIRVAPISPVLPLLPPRPVFVQPPTTQQPPTEKQQPSPTNPPQSVPSDSNVAIAVATANSAAPVATILLPPYPFVPPPSFGFIPSSPTFAPEEEREKENTTENTTQTEATTTEKVNDLTTPAPSNIDNNFVQALPSNQDVNFKQYLPPPGQLPLEPFSPPPMRPPTVNIPVSRPHKVKTTVEVMPVPLTYIAPPPLKQSHPLKIIKIKKHIHTYIPTGKVIIRPVSHRARSVRNHGYAMAYWKPLSAKNVGRYPRFISRRSKSRDIEPTTLRPFKKPDNRPTL